MIKNRKKLYIGSGLKLILTFCNNTVGTFYKNRTFSKLKCNNNY